MALTTGSRIGPYEIKSPLGEGGMGVVFRALDTKLHRTRISERSDLAKVRGRNVRRNRAEVCMVENIKHLSTQLR